MTRRISNEEFCANLDATTAATDASIRADAQALADVRTLDDWAKGGKLLEWSVTDCSYPGHDPKHWCCRLATTAGNTYLYGATPDEARAKAAAWVRGQR